MTQELNTKDNKVVKNFLFNLKENPNLFIGILMAVLLLVFWLVGMAISDQEMAEPISGPPYAPPSSEYVLGTDAQGRQMLPLMVWGVPLTLRMGLIAGSLGLLVGTILGFAAGYFGGLLDTIIRSLSDVVLTIPALAVLVVVASTISADGLSVESMAFIIAALAWMWPTRTIRAQVLSMRERDYVDVARLSGLNNFEIIIKELVPNLLPYLASSFVGAVASAILAAIGLEALGLGPQHEPTLGMTIFWANYFGAVISGWWWWYAPPIVLLIWLFVTLYLIAAGLDQWANPRLKRVTQ